MNKHLLKLIICTGCLAVFLASITAFAYCFDIWTWEPQDFTCLVWLTLPAWGTVTIVDLMLIVWLIEKLCEWIGSVLFNANPERYYL